MKKTIDIFGLYLGILLILISPLCFGIGLGWRWGLFSMPFFHFAFCWLKINTENGSNTKTD